MVAHVTMLPSFPSATPVRVTYPVRGGPTMRVAGGLANWIQGRGATLIPFHAIDEVVNTSPSTLHYTVWPTDAATHRAWILDVSGSSAVQGTFTDPSGGTSAVWMSYPVPRRLIHIEAITSPGSGEAELAPTFVASAFTFEINSLACYEIPVPSLVVAGNALGVHIETLLGGQPIVDTSAADGASMGALTSTLESALGNARRAGLDHWSVSHASAMSTVSTSYVDMLTGGVNILARKVYRNDTEGTVQLRAYVSASSSTTGEILVTSTATGNTALLSIDSAAGVGWITGEINVDCEDLGASDGRRGATWDTLTWQWKRLTGVGTLFCSGRSVGES